MCHQLTILALFLLIFTLNGCASSQKKAANYDNILIGQNSSRVVDLFGWPIRDKSNSHYRVLSYCTTNEITDDLVDYWFKDNKLIHMNYYTNTRRGDCSNFFKPIDWVNIEKFDFNRLWKSTVYNIDLLKITHLRKRQKESVCENGHQNKLIVEGTIGPDSSFSVERLLEQITPCTDKSGKIIHPIKVSLKSQGGFLIDGYSLGRTLRKFNATTIIENDALCASSCAVAFLGGTKRSLDDNANILFHAPYLKHNSYQMKPSIECTKDKTLLDELEAYYIEMIGLNDGKRIFDRTMWYCSTEDGWVVTGENAAKLYGIATQ